jgi:tRNA(Arg) A34 adenosine deaminase TadA
MSSHPALTPVEVTMLMRFALSEAERGLKAGTIPIGCIVAIPGEHGLRIIGRGQEQPSSGHEGHAVKAALEAAVGKQRPGESGIVVVATLEPCAACMDLVRAAPIRQLVYGLASPSESGERRVSMGRDSESMMCSPGVMVTECRNLIYAFVEAGGHPPDVVAFAQRILRRASTRPHAA